MKRKFAFDAMECDYSVIDEQTIIKNTGVDTERIVNKVMNAVKSGKKPRHFSKKVIMGLAAAAIAVAAIGTVTVGAAGGFNQVFGDWFAGIPKYGLFSGDNVSCTSEKLDIDFQGIAGDDNFAGASMIIKNKDGSPFIESGEGEVVLYGSNNVDVTLSPIGGIFNDNSNRGGSVWYSLEDEGTIKATALYQDNNSHLKGERMTIKEESLTAMRLHEVVGDVSDDYDELVKKYEGKLEKNQIIFEYSGNGTYEDNKYYIATEYQIPLDFELGVTLNYRSAARTMDVAEGKNLSMNGVTVTINSLEAKSFGIDINATVSGIEFPEEPDYDNMDETETAMAAHDYISELNSQGFIIELDITMKDGSKLKAEADSRQIESNSETSSTGTINSLYIRGNSHTAIDPDEIESVTATAKPLTSE